MKKISVIAVMLIAVLMFCSCSQNEKIPNVITKINNNAIIEYGNNKYECHISRLTDGVVSITVNSPENISGLTFKFVDGKYSLSYNELLCKTDNVLLPRFSFPLIIINILSVADKQENLLYQSSEDNIVTFSGNSSYGKFNLVTDNNGKITKITQENSGLKVSIENE